MKPIDILGIDLGTSNSAIAIWDVDSGRPRVLLNSERQLLTPSVVTLDAETDQIIVGRRALDRITERPDEVIYSVKRFMGRSFQDRWVQSDRDSVTYGMQEDGHQVRISIGRQSMTPQEVSAEILRKLVHDAEAALGGTRVHQAVVTVPAYFNESQRQATKDAGEQAGLRIPRIINEPTAAALAFGLGSDPQTVAVYDLGGGTFDITILRIDHGLLRVQATGGDTHLGGDDFDMQVIRWMKQKYEQVKRSELPIEKDARLRAALREEAKRAKVALSTADEVPVQMPPLRLATGTSSLRAVLGRAEFDALVAPLVERSMEICDTVLHSAGVSPSNIDQALLVGGQTRSPAVRAAIAARYGWTLNTMVNPEEAVAEGAAVLGARLCGHLVDRVKLWDVIPLSLGIEVANGRLDRIVEANTHIPITVARSGPQGFTTQRDGQQRVRLKVYQGERPMAADNHFLGELVLNLIAARPAGAPRIDCSFAVDHDGILHVRAEDADTEGMPVEATFDHLYRMTNDQVDEALREAKSHREEDERSIRLLRVQEGLSRLRQDVSNRTPDDEVLQMVEELEVAIAHHDVNQAEKLLLQFKEAHD